MDFNQHFDEADAEGVFVLYNSKLEGFLTNDQERAQKRFLPASTFKVLHSLIALEAGVLASEEEIIPWDGVDRGWSRWNQDLDMQTAIQYSAVWFYQEIARRIGQEQMQYYVDEVGYGNRNIGGGIDQFWLQGELRISPYEQIQFLRRLYNNDLPFSQRSMDTVKKIILVEETESYILRAKSGLGIRSDAQTGWYVGYVERDTETLFFAINLDIRKDKDTEARIAITRRILKDMGALN